MENKKTLIDVIGIKERTNEVFEFFNMLGFFNINSNSSRVAFLGKTSTENDFTRLFPTINYNLELLDALLYEAKKIQAEKKAKRELSRAQKLASLPISGGSNTAKDHIKLMPAGKYVLTSAQNNTDIDSNMFYSLLEYCKANDAKLLIGRLTYNKSGFAQPDINSKDTELWYDANVTPYLVNGHISLDNKFHFLADVNVIPTARNPLTGLEAATESGIHAIIPATKIMMKVSAALKNAKTKIICSTGAVTKRNYILRRAGMVASIEHNISAIYIDTESGDIRQLEQMEGFSGFFDFHTKYEPTGVKKVNNIECLQLGDIHAEKLSKSLLESTCNLVSSLMPKHIFCHDVLDFSSRNHHNIKDSTFIHLQHVNNNTVKSDLKSAARVIDSLKKSCSHAELHIIESNHDLALSKWLKEQDFKNDPINAVVYLQCMLALYKYQESNGTSDFNMLKYAYKAVGRGKFSDSINFHETDESVIIAGVEHGCHGHNGVNGSRGNPASFRSLGTPLNTGHTHSPSIHGKVYTAGVTNESLDMGYNLGASSWARAHIITYTNGQRQILFV